MGQNVVLEFDRNPNISEMDRLQSFLESVQRAFNEFEMTMDDLDLEEHPMVKAMAGGDYRILFDDYGHFKVVTANAVEAKKGSFQNLSAENLLVTGGFLAKELNAETGSYSKYLAGVKIYGDLIEANTLRADTFILKGEDGIYRRLNIDALGETTVDSDPKYSEKLDGSVLVAESVTATQINVSDLFSQNIVVRGNFWLGQNGVLVYDSKDDALSMKAKKIAAATDEGLVLSDKTGKNAIHLMTQDEQAVIRLLDGAANMTANANGGLSLNSQKLLKFFTKENTGIESYNFNGGNVKVALIEQLTTGTLPEMTLSCRQSEGYGLGGGNGYFENRVQSKAYVKINSERVLLGYITPDEVGDEEPTLALTKKGTEISGSLILNGNAMGDFIVAQGQADGWFWEHWVSGKAVAWKQYNIAITGWKQWGSLYEASPQIGSYDIPEGIFLHTPNFDCKAQCPGIGVSGVETYGAGSSTKTPEFWMLRPSDPGTTGLAMVLIKAIGRWK